MKKRRGVYTKKIIDDYCVLDIETTGLSYQNDKIIEIGIVKIRNKQIVEKYSQLINPECQISHFITQLTGISNNMVQDKPTLNMIFDDVFDFIGGDVIIGHNTSFDLNFMSYQFDINITNEYMDTLQFSRKVYPELSHHRLSDMVEYLNLSNNEHRALADCIATYELYEKCKEKIEKEKIFL